MPAGNTSLQRGDAFARNMSSGGLQPAQHHCHSPGPCLMAQQQIGLQCLDQVSWAETLMLRNYDVV